MNNNEKKSFNFGVSIGISIGVAFVVFIIINFLQLADVVGRDGLMGALKILVPMLIIIFGPIVGAVIHSIKNK